MTQRPGLQAQRPLRKKILTSNTLSKKSLCTRPSKHLHGSGWGCGGVQVSVALAVPITEDERKGHITEKIRTYARREGLSFR